MAKSGGSAVSPRRIIAGGFVFVGLFAMCFGLGSRSQALMVIGAAVIVMAFSVRLFSSVRRSQRQWVLGTGQVLEVSGDPPSDLQFGRCTIHLAVDAPGLPPESVRVTDNRVPVGSWPYPSQELPIEVASDDPRQVRIRWNQLASASNQRGGNGPAGAGYTGDPGYGSGFAPDLDAPDPGPGRPGDQATAPPAREVRIDFDLDRPPPQPPRMDPEQAANRPVVTPLPAELGEPGGHTGAGGGPDLPKPRRRPRPYPSQTQAPVAALPAGTPKSHDGHDGHDPDGPGQDPDVSGDGTGTAIDTAATSDAPARDTPVSGGELPEPVLAGAAVGAAGAAGGRPGAKAAGAQAASAAAVAPRGAPDDLGNADPSPQPGSAGTFTNVGITVLVSDLRRSIAFYRDQLGFYEVDGGAGNAVLASGETRLVLREAPTLEKTRHRSVYLNLEVADLEVVYTELRAGGVGFTNPPRRVDRTERLELWAATFRDPDGHGIALTQWRPAH